MLMRVTLRAVCALAVFLSGAAASADPFDDLGTLVAGVECTLFQADSGGLYVLDNTTGFNVGDRVRVTGDLSSDCVSACQQGDGCISNAYLLDGGGRCPRRSA